MGNGEGLAYGAGHQKCSPPISGVVHAAGADECIGLGGQVPLFVKRIQH